MDNILNAPLAPVLIVEDEEDHANLIIRALKEKSNLLNNLVWLENGQKAIDYLYEQGDFKNTENPVPGLILLDIKMPLKNGFDVLNILKNDEDLKRIPVVMLSTSHSSDDVKKALSLGANDYIVKPVGFTDFLTKINNLGYYWCFISNSRS